MGFELSWLAIPATFERFALDILSLSVEETDEEPIAPMSLRHHETWSIIVEESATPTLLDELNVAAISKKCIVVLCVLDEHSMRSRAAVWEGGLLKSETKYDSSTDDRKAYDGEAMVYFASVQSLVDSGRMTIDLGFDAPIDKAEELTGFRHDRPQLAEGIPLFLKTMDGLA